MRISGTARRRLEVEAPGRPVLASVLTLLLSTAVFVPSVVAQVVAPAASADSGADRPGSARPISRRVQVDSVLPQVQRIDQALEAGWAESELVASPMATDYEFARRLYLDLLGRIPTVDELRDYVQDKQPDRKQRLVYRLVYDERYTIDFADHWATIWTNLLIGRRSNDNDNDRTVDRAGLEKYLRDSFARQVPYDRMVHELISAVGTNKPGSPKFNGAVNFLSGKLDDEATLATADTSKLFLGMQVQCTQCHNHPFNEWKQNQFWELNSFFRQTTTLRRFEQGTRDVAYVELADQDFGGEDRPMDPEQARIYYELRNGKLEAAFPVFVDGTSIGTSGLVEQVNRRAELADLIVRSPYLSRAIVNRLWAHFLGYGFTRPVDDMGPHNPPVYPDLLDELANELQQNSYDLRQLMAWIVLSKPYALSSRATAQNERDDPALGVPPRFSRFYLRQMTAEQLYRSLLTASQADKTAGSLASQAEAQRKWLQQFTIAFGTDEGEETTTFDGTITQTLMMFNGELIQRATDGSPGSFLHGIAKDPQRRTIQKLQELFLASVGRPATKDEFRAYQQLALYHGQDELKALQDIWWALLNSNEFILNH